MKQQNFLIGFVQSHNSVDHAWLCGVRSDERASATFRSSRKTSWSEFAECCVKYFAQIESA